MSIIVFAIELVSSTNMYHKLSGRDLDCQILCGYFTSVKHGLSLDSRHADCIVLYCIVCLSITVTIVN